MTILDIIKNMLAGTGVRGICTGHEEQRENIV